MKQTHPLPTARCRCQRGLAPVALFFLLISGCRDAPPVERATRHFTHGRFDAAIELVDASVGQTTEIDQVADLLRIKGRCYWEMANLTDQTDVKTPLLDKAIASLTKSIEAKDSSEARYVRASVYEANGDAELASVDKAIGRTLDPYYASAYANEKPEQVLLDLADLEASGAHSAETSTDASGKNSLAPRDSPDYASGPDGDDSEISRDGDTPWTPASPRSLAGGGRSADVGDSSRLEDPESRYRRDRSADSDRGLRSGMRRAFVGDLTTNSTLPQADDEENADTDGDADQSTDRDTARGSTTGDEDRRTAESVPPVRRPLSSTWQPLRPPVSYGKPTGLPRMPPPPSTGLVGPDFGRTRQAPPTGAIPFGYAPTTGITGPSALRRPTAPPTVGPNPSAPTTGIGAGPLNSALPSGLPTEFMPLGSAVMPRLPFTGALPPQFQPPGGAPALGPAFPTTGPNYSPLRPSPLTAPNSHLLGAPLGTPNARPRPLATPTVPPRPIRPATPLSPQRRSGSSSR